MAKLGKLFIFVYTFGFVGIIINGASLILLVKSKKSRMDKTQRWIIINLCVFNSCLSLTYTIINSMTLMNTNDTISKDGDYNGGVQNGVDDAVLYVTEEGVNVKLKYVIPDAIIATFVIGTYLATLWLVLDRLFHIKLILKYACFWSHTKTVITTLVMWVVAVLIGSFMRIYLRGKLAYICNVIYIVMDSFIIVLSTYVYANALIISQKRRKSIRSNQSHESKTKGLLLSVNILLTFIVTVTVPDIILVINNDRSLSKGFAWYVFLCNYFSLLTDAVIYILLSPQVRRYCKNNFKFFLRSSNSTALTIKTFEMSKVSSST